MLYLFQRHCLMAQNTSAATAAECGGHEGKRFFLFSSELSPVVLIVRGREGKAKSRRGIARKQKAGRNPIRDDEGPAKNPLSKRQRNAQQDTKTLRPVTGLFRF